VLYYLWSKAAPYHSCLESVYLLPRLLVFCSLGSFCFYIVLLSVCCCSSLAYVHWGLSSRRLNQNICISILPFFSCWKYLLLLFLWVFFVLSRIVSGVWEIIYNKTRYRSDAESDPWKFWATGHQWSWSPLAFFLIRPIFVRLTVVSFMKLVQGVVRFAMPGNTFIGRFNCSEQN
jgi:hypothetical protein